VPRKGGKSGICHICGNDGPLSFEHIPPKKAFNDRQTIALKLEEAIQLGPDETFKGRIQQGGAGDYTLCRKCNSLTGTWYARHFIDWCYQGMLLLQKSGGHPSLSYPYHLCPLSVIKQMVAMFLSINTPEFCAGDVWLRRFVLNPELKYLPPKYRFFVYYNLSRRLRYVGFMVRSDPRGIVAMGEISYPPFGYVMTLDSPPPDNRLLEITSFSRFDYTESKMLQLRLPTLPVETAFPGDYRSAQEIRRSVEQQNAEKQARTAARTKR
jgi:hypothetical protein